MIYLGRGTISLSQWLFFKPGLPDDTVVKDLSASAGDVGSILGPERFPGEENGKPLHTVAWKTLWTEKAGRLQSKKLQRVGHN